MIDERQADPTPAHPTAGAENCPATFVTGWQAAIDNIPYAAMIVLGSAIFALGLRSPAAWIGAIAFALYGLGGPVWIMLFVCPYCHFHGTRLCPCGYGRIAARLRSGRDAGLFQQQFSRHIPVIVPLWIAPPVVAAFALVRGFSAGMLVLLAVFVVNSFVLLPLVSRKYGCAKCPQKETCPWMGRG